MNEEKLKTKGFFHGSEEYMEEALSFCHYDSPLGRLFMASDRWGLSRVWFAGFQEDMDRRALSCTCCSRHNEMARKWLDGYFRGRVCVPFPELSLYGTPFQIEIWKMLCDIPYGETVTYGDLAHEYVSLHGVQQMSAQAVGQAVGKNPVCILIPCHRVVGAGNKLVGYRYGRDRKSALLDFETSAVFPLENRTAKRWKTRALS